MLSDINFANFLDPASGWVVRKEILFYKNINLTRFLFLSPIEPEEPLVKVELMEKNFGIIKQNRFHDNMTSMSFKDGLKLNKRKATETKADNSVSFICKL